MKYFETDLWPLAYYQLRKNINEINLKVVAIVEHEFISGEFPVYGALEMNLHHFQLCEEKSKVNICGLWLLCFGDGLVHGMLSDSGKWLVHCLFCDWKSTKDA